MLPHLNRITFVAQPGNPLLRPRQVFLGLFFQKGAKL
jgi:hypothetical protein